MASVLQPMGGNCGRTVMRKWVLVAVVMASVSVSDRAFAQEGPAGAGRLEVTVIPGGWVGFVEDTEASAPSFSNYQLGGAFTFNINRFVGIEGEVDSSRGLSQTLEFGYPSDVSTPDMLTSNGNVLVSVPTGKSVVPYAASGVGWLSLFSREEFGITDTETLFTTNVGGGVKWYAGRWGLRADYRFIVVPSRDEVSAFGFGTDARYGHRIYGAFILNVAH